MASVELVVRAYGAEPVNELLKVLSPARALGVAGGLLLVGVLVGMLQSAVLRAALGFALLGAGIWLVLGSIHDAVRSALPLESGVGLNLSLMLIALAVFAVAAGVALAVLSRVRPFLLSVLTVLLFLALEVVLYS